MIADEAFTTILIEYSDFTDIFSKESTAVLLENNKIKTHVIDLKEGKQSLYGSIYSLRPVKLKTAKTYIETNLANNFIRPSKSSTSTPILFDKKPNKTFWLYDDYQGLNNIIIKNQYLHLFISQSFNCPSHIQ